MNSNEEALPHLHVFVAMVFSNLYFFQSFAYETGKMKGDAPNGKKKIDGYELCMIERNELREHIVQFIGVRKMK